MTTSSIRAGLLSLLLTLPAYAGQAAEATPPAKPSIADQAKAFGNQVKQDAREVGKAVKEEAIKVGHAARKQAHVLKSKVTAHTSQADAAKPK